MSGPTDCLPPLAETLHARAEQSRNDCEPNSHVREHCYHRAAKLAAPYDARIREQAARIAALEAEGNSMHNASADLIRERDELKTKLKHLEAELRERREDWAKRIDAMEAENKQLRAACRAVFALISESRGVAGLHLNGDEASWDSLLCGQFSGWLEKLEEVRGIVEDPAR